MRPSPARATCLGLFAALVGCEPMASSGNPFAPATRAEAPAAPPPKDPAFDFPADPPVLLTSEQLAGATATSAPGAATTPPALAAASAPVAPSPAVGLPAATQWPVRLVSTLAEAQPPRAILGLPDGEERVVSPGSILAEEGLVVMSVSDGRVQLARVAAAGDHASIEPIELVAQYPASR